MKTNTNQHALKSASVAGLIVASIASPALAQDTTAYDLEDLTVVANRMEMPLDRVGSKVEIVTALDIELDRQPFLLDNLRSTPGIVVRNSGGPGNAFGITTRGLNSNTPIVLLDGIKLSNPASGKIINFGNLFGDNVNRVEVLKGAQSSLYGADAIAGVISIQTQDGRTNPGGTLSLSAGSNETYTSNLGYNTALSEKLSINLNASHYSSSGISIKDPALGSEWADEDSYENMNFSTKLDYEISPNTQLNFLAYYVESKADFDPSSYNPHPTNFSEDQNLFMRVGGETVLSEAWSSSAGFSFTNTNTASIIGLDTYPNNGDRYAFDWKNELTLNDAWQMIAGFEYEKEDNRADTGDRDNYSVYSENVLRVTDNFDLTGGVRFDDNSDYGDNITYRATANYRFTETGTRVHASYGTSFHAPSFYNLTSFYGNPDLKPEEGDGWDIGIDQALLGGKIRVSSTLFGYDITDKIIYDYGTSKYANASVYKSKGIENGISYQVTESFSAKLAYTYSDATSDDKEAARVPRNVTNLDLIWRGLDNKLNLKLNTIYTGTQFSNAFSTEKLPHFTLVNLSSGYDVSETVQVWARIDNLLDEDYQEIENYMTRGFSFYAGVRLGF